MPNSVIRRLRPLLPALVVMAAACNDNNGLPDAFVPNVVDTFSLGALVGTGVTVPSAFSVGPANGGFRGGPVRSDQTSGFDFAFNIDETGRPVFLPLSVLGLGTGTSSDPGLRPTTATFANVLIAPTSDYVTQDTVPFAVGDRFALRSRISCSLGVPQYGKLEVLAVDQTTRTVTFQALTNNNCGYKALTPGLPDR